MVIGGLQKLLAQSEGAASSPLMKTSLNQLLEVLGCPGGTAGR